jgi:hypothetical protein
MIGSMAVGDLLTLCSGLVIRREALAEQAREG